MIFRRENLIMFGRRQSGAASAAAQPHEQETYDESGDTDIEDADIVDHLQQLKHEHESLLREKRKMQEYMVDVEAEAQDKDQRLVSLSEALRREQNANKDKVKQLADLERRLAESSQEAETEKIRRRRMLPNAPAVKFSLEEHNLALAGTSENKDSYDYDSAEVISKLKDDVIRLQDALQETKELLIDRGGSVDGLLDSKGNAINLSDEIKASLHEVDEEALVEMAKRFNELNEQVAQSEKALIDLREELEATLELNDMLAQELVESRAEADENGDKARSLQDALDEALLQLKEAKMSGSAIAHEPAQADVSLDESIGIELELTEENKELARQLAKVEGERRELQKRISVSGENKSQLETTITMMKTRQQTEAHEYAEKVASLEAQLAASNRAMEETQSDLQSMKDLAASSKVAGEQDLATLKSRFAEDMAEYKQRSEASKKETEDNLLRMIEHLEHEKRSLSDALEVAKKSVKTVQSSSSDLTVELAKVQEELLLEQEKVQTLSDQNRLHDDRYQRLENAHVTMEEHVEEVTTEWKKSTAELGNLREMLTTLKDHNSKYSDHVKAAHSEARQLAAENATLQEELRKSRVALKEAEEANADAIRRLELSEDRLESTIKQKDSLAENARNNFESSIAASKEQIGALSSQLQDAQLAIDLHKVDALHSKDELDKLKISSKQASETDKAEIAKLRESHFIEIERISQKLRESNEALELQKQEFHQLTADQNATTEKAQQLQILLEEAKKQRQIAIENLKIEANIGVKEIQDELASLRLNTDAVQAELVEHSTPISKMTEVVESQVKLDILVVKLHDSHEAEITTYKGKISDLESSLKMTEDEIDIVKKNAADLTVEIDTLRKQNIAKQSEIGQLNSKLVSAGELASRAGSEIASLKQSLDGSKKAQADIDAKALAATQEMERQKAQAESVARALAEYLDKISVLEQSNTELDQKNLQLKTELSNMKTDAGDTDEKYERLRMLFSELQEKLELSYTALHDATIALDERTRELQEQQEAYELLNEKASTLQDEHSDKGVTEAKTQALLDSVLKQQKQLQEQVQTSEKAAQEALDKLCAEVNIGKKLKAERIKLSQELSVMQNQQSTMVQDAEASQIEFERVRGENERLRETLRKAGANVKLHMETAELKANDLAKIKRAFDESELNNKRLKVMVEQREAADLKIRKKIISSANVEIEAGRKRESELKAQMSKMCSTPNLTGVFGVLAQLSQVLESKTKSPMGGPPRGINGSVADQVGAVEIQLKYIQGLVNRVDAAPIRRPVASMKRSEVKKNEAKSKVPIQTLNTSVPKLTAAPKLPVGPPRMAKQVAASNSAGDGAIDRLLTAVKRFYKTKNEAMGVDEGVQLQDSPVRKKEPQIHSKSSAEPSQVAIQPPPYERLPETKVEAHVPPGQEFKPESFPDDFVEQIKLPERALSELEQTHLKKDWIRLKDKVRALVSQIVSAKAAIASMRFNEQRDHVYLRNRDRLVGKLLEKCGGRPKKIAQLKKMLEDSGL